MSNGQTVKIYGQTKEPIEDGHGWPPIALYRLKEPWGLTHTIDFVKSSYMASLLHIWNHEIWNQSIW